MTATRIDNPAASRPKRVRTRCRRQCMRWLTRASPKQRTTSRTRRPPPRKQAMPSKAPIPSSPRAPRTLGRQGFRDRPFQHQRRLRLCARIAGREDAIGVFGAVDCTRAPAVRDHDGANQGTRDFGAEGLGRDRRARSRPGSVERSTRSPESLGLAGWATN